MSHDGVRFISAQQAAADRARDQRRLSGEALRPGKISVDKTGGTGMSIQWRDGHESHWGFRWLREACPCATCHEAREGDGRAPGESKAKPVSLLPMFEAPPRPQEVEPVGKYAIRFHWNDGHEAGIYSWDYLRNVCDFEARRQGVLQPESREMGSSPR